MIHLNKNQIYQKADEWNLNSFSDKNKLSGTQLNTSSGQIEIEKKEIEGKSEATPDIGGSEVPKCSVLKITSLHHEKFRQIIDLDGISVEEISNSLDLNLNRSNVFNAGEGAGQSGSFFFFTYDRRFLIKTLQNSE